MTDDYITGEINGIKFSIEKTIIDRLKNQHGIDAMHELVKALSKNYNENKSTEK